MWIQIRTIDGKETRTVEDLSRLTKIESLRAKIRDIFDVKPEQQRLFYRGKQMEDGQTLFDYNVGLNDIVQLLIRSQSDPPESPALNNGQGVACVVAPPLTTSVPASATPTTTAVSPTTVSNSNGNDSKSLIPESDSEPSTSSRTFLLDPGIGHFKVNELVDCRDVSIGAWFEGVIDKVTPACKGQNRVGRPSKRTNGKLESEANADSTSTPEKGLNLDNSQSTTSKTDSANSRQDVSYHIKYEDYPENGVVAMSPDDVRPRARTLLRFDQLQVGDVVMVNYNLELPEERGFWYDAEILTLNAVSRTNKEIHVKILLGGPGDVIGDCKLQFLDEIYRIEKPGAPALSSSDGPFKRKSGPECKHCKADPDTECRFCSCCVCGGKQDAHMQLLCDECNMAFHIYCLNPPLSSIPEDEDWYCPTCKNDSSEVVKAGEKLRTSKKKSKMPSATTESQRDWGKGMACVGRTKECTIVPSNHYGPVPGVPVGTTWKFRVQVSEAGVHRPHVGGIHGRSNDGSYSLVLAGGFEDEVDRGDEFTYTGSGGRDLSGNKRIGEHSFDQTLTHMNRALALNCDAPLNDKDGAESRNWRAGKPVRVIRSSKGRRISKYAPEEGNRYDGIYKVVKYWPEIGKCGFLVWRYLLRRDDLEPAPWTPEGTERSKKLGLKVQYPPGYLEAMANKTKREATVRSVGGSTHTRGRKRGRPRSTRPTKRLQEEEEEKPVLNTEEELQSNGSPDAPEEHNTSVCEEQEEPQVKRLKEVESFVLSEQQRNLIEEDEPNRKLWDEALSFLTEGPNFLRKVEQMFMCVCCQELSFQPVTTECTHTVCKSCLQRSFRAEVFTCPACRHDLGRDYAMSLNKTLQLLLDQFFPGYSKGR
ncbi:E3 ubiquitin-protein ligase UHRF2-like [Pimephales promelas]|uniref:E3 ubiquitin-protein ligase UHRF2-like n=1 Tax=Pimephales promelas TaxID=90988 RepID=UPI001955DE59|nr:E3 ubiquitin-protein ligase UHRF2-like [Pimephales promelas]KAG1929764.1 E3 ubiquitin-protein ligase UHRF1 [Pimephales promelas]